MRRVATVLTVSSLFWPSALWILAQPASDSAFALGSGLGQLQRVGPAGAPTPLTEVPRLVRPGDPDWEQADESAEEAVAGEAAGPGDEVNESSAGSASRPTRKRARVRTSKSASKAVSPKNEAPTPSKGLRVSASTVLRLANAKAIPQGAYQPATGKHPGGMRLLGVSGMGVGLQDGDVLSDVAGTPASSRSAVVSAVLAARAKRARAISATFWRDGEPWRLIVEMPYLRHPTTTSVASGNVAPPSRMPPSSAN